jgi:hypothetical protein
MKRVYICGIDEIAPGPYRGKPGDELSKVEKVMNCVHEKEHSYGPSGYLNWHEWARVCLRDGWTNEQCPGCGYWLIVRHP